MSGISRRGMLRAGSAGAVGAMGAVNPGRPGVEVVTDRLGRRLRRGR